MAKLNAPLLSLGASGQIGKAVVYFPWKGLNCARQFVVPSNPNTSVQQTQRGHLSWAVLQVHGAEANATHPLSEQDKIAYATLGSCEPTPSTWFNAIIKMCIDQRVAGLDGGIYHYSAISQGAATITLDLWFTGTTNPTALKIYWGTSKTALVNSAVALVLAGDHFNADCSGLVAGTKYYFQMRPTAPADCVGLNTGIYHAIKT